jgi:hypothetical protein
VGGYYLLLNVFGRPTGGRAFVERGGLVPTATQSHRWRLDDAADDNWMCRAMRWRRPLYAVQDAQNRPSPRLS